LPDFPTAPFLLPPAEAIAFFEKKGFEITWDWRAQLEINNAQVFTVAKAMKMDILMDIRAMMDDALKNGTTFKQFQKDLEPTLRAKGWWGKREVEGPGGVTTVQLGSPHRLKTIYDTNLQASYNAGRWKAQESGKKTHPYLRYVAILDAQTRPSHAELHGTIKPVDSPFWDVYYPPNGYRCRCRAVSVTVEGKDKRGGVTKGIPKNPNGKTVKPDKGFFNNPGKDKWKPDREKYDHDIWKKAQPITKG